MGPLLLAVEDCSKLSYNVTNCGKYYRKGNKWRIYLTAESAKTFLGSGPLIQARRRKINFPGAEETDRRVLVMQGDLSLIPRSEPHDS